MKKFLILVLVIVFASGCIGDKERYTSLPCESVVMEDISESNGNFSILVCSKSPDRWVNITEIHVREGLGNEMFEAEPNQLKNKNQCKSFTISREFEKGVFMELYYTEASEKKKGNQCRTKKVFVAY